MTQSDYKQTLNRPLYQNINEFLNGSRVTDFVLRGEAISHHFQEEFLALGQRHNFDHNGLDDMNGAIRLYHLMSEILDPTEAVLLMRHSQDESLGRAIARGKKDEILRYVSHYRECELAGDTVGLVGESELSDDITDIFAEAQQRGAKLNPTVKEHFVHLSSTPVKGFMYSIDFESPYGEHHWEHEATRSSDK